MHVHHCPRTPTLQSGVDLSTHAPTTSARYSHSSHSLPGSQWDSFLNPAPWTWTRSEHGCTVGWRWEKATHSGGDACGGLIL